MTPDTGAFTLIRRFALPPDRLWHWLTDPQARSAWGGPSDDDVLILDSHDLREGGIDRHRCGPADDPAYTVQTIWYRLDAPNLACFSETVDTVETRIATSLVTYGLATADRGSALTVTVQVSSFVGREALADFEAGWTSSLQRLGQQTEGAMA